MATDSANPKVVRARNARILDYRQLKITIQTKSAHRLPTTSQLHKSFSVYGECSIERLGIKSNQYMLRYKTPNAGFQAFTKQNHTVINQGTVSIKYQWNSYCPSIFHSQSSNLSMCPKGSKCTLIHHFKAEHEAFAPSGDHNQDNLAFERFKLLRFRQYNEYDSVEDLDLHNMEGIIHKSNHDIKPNKTPMDSPSSSASTSSSASIITKQKQSKDEKMNKQKLATLLKQKLESGISPNCKIYHQKAVKVHRPSPPLKAPIDDNASLRSSHSSKSAVSARSSRSTVYVPQPNIAESSSESESSSPLFGAMPLNTTKKTNDIDNTEQGLTDDDWNALNDARSVSEGAKTDTVAMRYLSNDDGNITSNNESASRGSVRKNKKETKEASPIAISPIVNQVIKQDKERSSVRSESPKSSVSAEIPVLRKEINSNRVPVIDPNTRTVSYISSEHKAAHHNGNIKSIGRYTNNVFQNRMSAMQNQMMHPMNNVNAINMHQQQPRMHQQQALLSAPPYYPHIQNPMQNGQFMGMTGSILAGTLRPTHAQPNSNMNVMQNQAFVSQSPVYNRGITNEHNANSIQSIPTTAVNTGNTGNRVNVNKRVSANKKAAKYKCSYNCNLPPPTNEEDFHWLCYHYRSGNKYSCTFGNGCKWRHYDFSMRADVMTQWHPSKPVHPRDRPKMKQLAEARLLRKSLQKRYKWLVERKYSQNPYIVNNPTPPSTKKRRLQRKHQVKKEEEMDEIRMRLMVQNEEMDEKLKDNCENKDEEQHEIESENGEVDGGDMENVMFKFDRKDMEDLRTEMSVLDSLISDDDKNKKDMNEFRNKICNLAQMLNDLQKKMDDMM